MSSRIGFLSRIASFALFLALAACVGTDNSTPAPTTGAGAPDAIVVLRSSVKQDVMLKSTETRQITFHWRRVDGIPRLATAQRLDSHIYFTDQEKAALQSAKGFSITVAADQTAWREEPSVIVSKKVPPGRYVLARVDIIQNGFSCNADGKTLSSERRDFEEQIVIPGVLLPFDATRNSATFVGNIHAFGNFPGCEKRKWLELNFSHWADPEIVEYVQSNYPGVRSPIGAIGSTLRTMTIETR